MMRLQRLGLEFFGHFTDKWLDFGDRPKGKSDFHLIYGPNEAGKTTTMEGYLRLLYGFNHKEPYDFKHKRANLKVSGTLQLDDDVREFTRLPGRKNNLVDASGTPLPEQAIQGALSGLAIKDYRQLLCLDDATIEEGGDEIANSKGDIGRLLFSAAAGVSDLSKILDTVEEQGASLYKKGGSKSEFAQLKRALDVVTSQIRATDVSVTDYRQRRQAFDEASAEEKIIRSQRLEIIKEKTRLQSMLLALPKLADLARLDDELVPLEHFPAYLDIDPEDLVALSKRRALTVANVQRLDDVIVAKTAEQNEIKPPPDMEPVQKKLEDLSELRARCGTAATDLPRRQVQLDSIAEDMKRSLFNIGLQDIEVPEEFVIQSPQLRALEAAFQSLLGAKSALEVAKDEEETALQSLKVAEKIVAETPVLQGDRLDLQQVLELQNASRVVTEYQKAGEAKRLVERSAQEALSRLSFDGQTFETVPALSVRAEDASTLAREIEACGVAIINAESDFNNAREATEMAQLKIKSQVASGALVTDEAARVSRSARDQLWQEHLRDLSQPSADKFENAMHLDDTRSAARHGQAKELAEIRYLEIALIEMQRTSKSKEETLEKARKRLADLRFELGQHLTALGLTTGLSASGFADWIQKAEVAQAALNSLQIERDAAKPAFAAAEGLRETLIGMLGVPDGTLEALVDFANKTAAEHLKNKGAVQTAQKAARDAKSEHKKRQDKAHLLDGNLETARNVWSEMRDQALGPVGVKLAFPQAFEAFQEILVLNQNLINVRRQIDSMKSDDNAFAAALEPMIEEFLPSKDIPAIEAFDAISRFAANALKASETRTTLSEQIEAAKSERSEASQDLEGIDAQVRLSAGIFDTSICTNTVESLRGAVLQGKRAIELREQISQVSSDLCSILNVSTKAEAESSLADQTLPDLQAFVLEAEQDLAGLEAELTAAIEKKTIARSDLEAITGGADVAVLVARRQTLELEMESVLRRSLELKVGHMLAERAIRRYRDAHRSGMMQSAQASFAELTNGAYCGLTSQIDGPNETLVAIQSSDGAAKEAYAMSKGTRFQLYLALRAAAYEQMAANGTVLPFFCDDVFETFDEDRTRAACGLMRRIGLTGQAVYLTHHHHVVDIAKEVCGDEVRVHQI